MTAQPTVVVLCDEDRPPTFEEVEQIARVRYVSADELAKSLPGSDVLFVWDFLSTAVPGAWPSVDPPRWVHVASAGVDRVLFPGLVESDTVVTNSRGIFEQPIAEYVLGLVLAFAKDLPTTVALQATRRWRHRETEPVAGRHALIVGAGPIGRSIARLLGAAGVTVSGVGRTARDDPDFGAVTSSDRLHEALPVADYVIVAAPLTAETQGMFDAAAFARMKPSARFINIARGPLVVEDALVKVLHEGGIGGAALDVFAEEPLSEDHPLWTLPNVIVSPHMAGDLMGWKEQLAQVFADNLGRFAAGRPLRNVVDKRLGYVPGKAR